MTITTTMSMSTSLKDNVDDKLDLEIPQYFICPISLQIMKDPVTAVSGITYDRQPIEHWLFNSHNTICPVTKQPLPPHSDLTPNHTLRRLIQAWSTAHGVDRIPTPKPPLSKFHLLNLISHLHTPSLQKLETLAIESDRNRLIMVQSGIGNALIDFIVTSYKNRDWENGLEEALSLFYIIRGPLMQSEAGIGKLTEIGEVFDALIWVLGFVNKPEMKAHAACVLKIVVRLIDPWMLENLKVEFFEGIRSNLRSISPTGMNALLQVLLEVVPRGRNRVVMVEIGLVFDLIELEVECSTEKKTTEVVLGILYHLCCCAEGRAELVRHAAGVATVTSRILTVSGTADDRAVLIVWMIAKYSGGSGVVVQELLRVGTVVKLCMVMQADCGSHLKERSREILRRFFDVFKDSPCVQMATLTRFAR